MNRELIGEWINIILLIAGVIGIIYPAFIDERASLTQIMVSLFEPSWSLPWISRWLVVLVIIGSAYALIVGRIYRAVPITILHSDVTMKYLVPDGSMVELSRSQTLRANQRNVTAIIGWTSPSTPTGRVPKDKLTASAYCSEGSLDGQLVKYGQEDRQVELIHMFIRPMPYIWFMPLIPVGLLRREYDQVPRLFRRWVVKRTQSATYENEFNQSPGVMQFIAEAYPSYEFKVTLDFSAGTLPSQVAGLRIKNNGVTRIDPEYIQTKKQIIYRVDKLTNERLRISWS